MGLWCVAGRAQRASPAPALTARARARPCPPAAEDLGEEDLDVLCGICGEVFDSPPANGFVFGEIARRIRVDLDKKLQARGWCVVVGRSFGAFITQKIKSYAFISVYPGVSILVWKA